MMCFAYNLPGKFFPRQVAPLSRTLPVIWSERVLGRGGMPAAEIVATARREKIDITAMSTQSRGALKRLFIGSTADQVMRNAHCPVLSVRLH